MDALSLATDGIICLGDITQINRYILPLDLKLQTNTNKLTLESPETLKLYLKLCEE